MCAYRIMRIYGLNNFLSSLTVTFLSVFRVARSKAEWCMMSMTQRKSRSDQDQHISLPTST